MRWKTGGMNDKQTLSTVVEPSQRSSSLAPVSYTLDTKLFFLSFQVSCINDHIIFLEVTSVQVLSASTYFEMVMVKYVCFFHTGNPGVVGFYTTFMQTLYRLFGYQHPVWAVSHAGHCAPPDSMDMIEGMDYF